MDETSQPPANDDLPPEPEAPEASAASAAPEADTAVEDGAPDPEAIALARFRAEQGQRAWDRSMPDLEALIGTSGLPPTWRRVLQCASPVLGGVSCALSAALHEEAPGVLTEAELRELVDDAADALHLALIEEFTP